MMKKIFVIVCMLTGAWGIGYSENAIKMVTYFPVPYVAYSNINASKQLDIGLVSSSVMSLGGEESAEAGLISLNVTNAYLRTGKLDLDMTAVLGNRILAGNRHASGTAELDFEQDLRINKLNDGYSIEADQMTTNVLNLFPERISNAFPSCAATAAEGAPQVSWQQLSIAGEPETFLVCGRSYVGTGVEDCSKLSYRKNHKEECCPCSDTSDSICYSPEESYMVKQGGTMNGTRPYMEYYCRISSIDNEDYVSYVGGRNIASNMCANQDFTGLKSECRQNEVFLTKSGNTTNKCYIINKVSCSSAGMTVNYTAYTCELGTSYVPNGWSGTGTCTQ